MVEISVRPPRTGSAGCRAPVAAGPETERPPRPAPSWHDLPRDHGYRTTTGRTAFGGGREPVRLVAAAGVPRDRRGLPRGAPQAVRATPGRHRGPDKVRQVDAGQRPDRPPGRTDRGRRVHPAGHPVPVRHGRPDRGDLHRRPQAGAAVRRGRDDPRLARRRRGRGVAHRGVPHQRGAAGPDRDRHPRPRLAGRRVGRPHRGAARRGR